MQVTPNPESVSSARVRRCGCRRQSVESTTRQPVSSTIPDQRELVRLELAMVVAADDSVQVEEEQLHALLCERGGRRGSCAGRHFAP